MNIPTSLIPNSLLKMEKKKKMNRKLKKVINEITGKFIKMSHLKTTEITQPLKNHFINTQMLPVACKLKISAGGKLVLFVTFNFIKVIFLNHNTHDL